MMAEDLSPQYERCRRVLAASRDGFWERHLASNQLWYSDSLLAFMGQTPPDTECGIDRSQAHVHPDDQALAADALAQALAHRGKFEFEARFLTAQQTWCWVRHRGRVWLDGNGQAEYLCGTVRDVHREKLALLALEAQQRELEALVRVRTAGLEAALALAEQRRQEAETANAAKSRFLAHMSHEIRTPLNGVLGLTELALRTPLSGEQRRYLESAHASGQALLRVISDVLDLSRIESGRMDLREEAFRPSHSLAEAMRAVMPLNHRPAVLTMFDWEGDDPWVMGDEGCLRQIATNLLGNALKFTESGLVSLHGLATCLPGGQVALTLTVRDSGPGIPEHLRTQVFEPFVQGDNSLARGHGGAGLGLAIASRMAEAMNAPLSLDCPPEGGSVFSLKLQLPLAPPPPLRPDMPPGPVGTAWLLYDHAAAGQWLARRLARLGWRTRVVPNVQAAIELAKEAATDPPELVLVAEKALKALTSLAPLRQALPQAAMRLIVRPDWHEPVLEAEAATLGIANLVAPLTPEQLLQICAEKAMAVEQAADRRRQAPELQPQAEVLLVEDNPVNQLVGQEFLRTLGLAVRLADDGDAALAACLVRSPQLVLMDLEMPGMDGLQAARELRALQRRGAWAGAPIVALTAHASAADRAACRAAGMDGVLTKPLSLQTLRKRLARWLAV